VATKTPDPRHRAVELIEQGLAESGCDTAPHLARWLIARLEATGLRITAAPALAEDPTASPLTDDSQPAPPNPAYTAARAALNDRTRT
jgi:hypothetical protein